MSQTPLEIINAQRAECAEALTRAIQDEQAAQKRVQQFTGSLAAIDLILARIKQAATSNPTDHAPRTPAPQP